MKRLKVIKKELDAIQYTGDNLDDVIEFYCHFNNDVLCYHILTSSHFNVIDNVLEIRNDKYIIEELDINDYIVFKHHKNQLRVLTPDQFNKKYVVVN